MELGSPSLALNDAEWVPLLASLALARGIRRSVARKPVCASTRDGGSRPLPAPPARCLSRTTPGLICPHCSAELPTASHSGSRPPPPPPARPRPDVFKLVHGASDSKFAPAAARATPPPALPRRASCRRLPSGARFPSSVSTSDSACGHSMPSRARLRRKRGANRLAGEGAPCGTALHRLALFETNF